MERISEHLRCVERINKDSSDWVICRMMELKEGDTFRMYEPSGEPVVWSGETIFVACGSPYLNSDGITAILADKVKNG